MNKVYLADKIASRESRSSNPPKPTGSQGMNKISEDSLIKAKKNPIASNTGMQMSKLMDHMKKHKSHKTMNECVSKMHGALSGVPVAGPIKTAYLAGFKYAEEEIAHDDSSEANPAHAKKDKSPEEKVIETMRRGWPDKNNSSTIKDNKEDGELTDDTYDPNLDLDTAKEKAQLTPHSPETTI